jgi:hypothetical protein
VIVQSGSTAVIAGLEQMLDGKTENGIPFLKNIPVFGLLFGSKNINNSNSNTLIYITPTILPDDLEEVRVADIDSGRARPEDTKRVRYQGDKTATVLDLDRILDGMDKEVGNLQEAAMEKFATPAHQEVLHADQIELSLIDLRIKEISQLKVTDPQDIIRIMDRTRKLNAKMNDLQTQMKNALKDTHINM